MTSRIIKKGYGTVTNVYWGGGSWTAPVDGILILRIQPNSGTSNWYWYINDTTLQPTTGSWAHQFRGTNDGCMTYCIPAKKNSVFSTILISGINQIYCFFYPIV